MVVQNLKQHNLKMTEEVVTVNNTSAKVPATTEGMMVAYGSLVIMALFPIFD